MVAAIPKHVSLDLEFPLLGELVAPLPEPPAMPEPAVDEDREPRRPEDDVGAARQVLAVRLKLQASFQESGGDRSLWSGIAATNAGHHRAARFLRHDVAPMPAHRRRSRIALHAHLSSYPPVLRLQVPVSTLSHPFPPFQPD